MIGRPASDETPPQLCLCVPLPTRLSVVRDQQPATDAADAGGAMAKDAADAPSEVNDGNASSAETDKTSADPVCPFLRVGGKSTGAHWKEQRPRRSGGGGRARWLDSEAALGTHSKNRQPVLGGAIGGGIAMRE